MLQPHPQHTPRRLSFLFIFGATFVSILLAGCTSGLADGAPPLAKTEVLSVPTSMTHQQPFVRKEGSLLAATETLPFAFGGSIIEPGRKAAPAVWLSADGKDWRRTVVDETLTGSFSGSLAGSDTLAALGGTEWKGRILTSKLWVSTDRETWTPVKLPADFTSRFRIGVLSVRKSRVLVIGQAIDGAVRGLSVSGTNVSEFKLPQPAKNELLSPFALAENSDCIVLIADPGPEGEQTPTVAYRSSDNGRSWSPPTQIAESTADVSGVVWTGHEFVATGNGRVNDEPGATARARAWSSVEGSMWKVESVPDPPAESPFYYTDIADSVLGAPSTADGTVAVIAANGNSSVSALYERSPNGVWNFGGISGINETHGGGGLAIPMAAGTALTLLGSSGYLRAGQFSEGVYVDGTVFSVRETLDGVSNFFSSRKRELILLTKTIFAADEDYGWRNSSQSSVAEYAGGDSTQPTAWDPEQLSELLDITMAVEGDGAEVVIGSKFAKDASTVTAEGYFRAAGESEWHAIAGFGLEGATTFSRVIHSGSGWVAVGGYRDAARSGIPSHGTIWTSADGENWAHAAGHFGNGRLQTSISDVCTLPNGVPLAVGDVEHSTGSYRIAVWSPANESWARVELGDAGEHEGFTSGCASNENGVVISATLAGRSVLLHTDDGVSWNRVFTADRGQILGKPVAVPGGFAAPGSWSKDSTISGAVWLSRDGLEWMPVAIPSQNLGRTETVAAYHDDLLISMNATSGSPLLVIRDIDKVIDDLLPK